MKLLLLLLTIVAASSAQVYNTNQTIYTSGMAITVPNQVGSTVLVAHEVVQGSPSTTTVVVQGCTAANSCVQIDSYTFFGNGYTSRTLTTTTSYDHYSIIPTWTGGTQPSVTIGTTITKSASSGGAVSSVFGRTGVITAATGDYSFSQISGTASSSQVPAVAHSIQAIFYGGSTALTAPMTAYTTVTYGCTIQGWNITATPAGSATVDVWKVAAGSAVPTVSNTITASAKPTIASGTAAQSTTLTGWTTAVSNKDIFAFNLSAVSTSTQVTVSLQCQ